MRTRRVLSFAVFLVALPVIGQAQMPGATQDFLPVNCGWQPLNEPVSAVLMLDYQPAVNSPNPVPVHGEQKFYRDRQGRSRWETTYSNKKGTKIDFIDPVAGYIGSWQRGAKHGTRYPFRGTRQAPGPDPLTLPPDAPKVEGIPTLYTHSAYGVGAKQQTVDSWYAPSLQLHLKSTVTKPAIGTLKYSYVHIQLGDPHPAKIRIPANLVGMDAKPQAPGENPSTPVGLPEADRLPREPLVLTPHDILRHPEDQVP